MTIIYCTEPMNGTQSFYVKHEKNKYFLFSQPYRKGVTQFYRGGLTINRAMDYSKTKNDTSIMKTMSKIPMYVKYIEKEFEVEILDRTAKKNKKKEGR